MKRIFTLAAVVAVLMSIGAPANAASPAPAGQISTIDRIFDLRGLSAGSRDVTIEVLNSFDFDWLLLEPALKNDGGRSRIEIVQRDTADHGAVGLAWPAPVGRIEIDDDVTNAIWFRDVLLHELAHIVDFYYLGPNELTDDVAAIYEEPWPVVSHSFNAAFVAAFSPFKPVDELYPLDDLGLKRLRVALGSTGEPPVETAADATSVRPIGGHRHLTSPSVPLGGYKRRF